VTGIVGGGTGGWVETGSVVVCGREEAWPGMKAEYSFTILTRSSTAWGDGSRTSFEVESGEDTEPSCVSRVGL